MMILHTKNMRRGTVLLLVVSVLALLAVMGTAYLVSSRTERSSSRAGTDATMMNLAQDAVISQVRQKLYEQAPMANWGAGVNYVKGDVVMSPFGPSDGRFYKCKNDHISANANTASGAGNAAWTANWDVTLRLRYYDYPETGTTFGQSADGAYQDEPLLVGGVRYNGVGDKNSASFLSALAFNPSTGDYDIGLPYPPAALPAANAATSPVGANVVGNPADPPAYADSYFYLLPFSSSNAVRYRFGVRVIDTSSMANLNTGWPGLVTDTYGQYLSSVSLSNVVSLSTDTPLDLQTAASPLGRNGTNPPAKYATSDQWHAQVLRIEKPSDNLISWFDLSDELELRAYGYRGTGTVCRPAATYNGASTWPLTLQAGNPNRQYFTTYSFDREMRRYSAVSAGVNAPYTCTLNSPPANYTNEVWARYPTKVTINGRLRRDGGLGAISSTNQMASVADVQAMANDLAPIATNVASAMELAGYSDLEARAAAANYLTYRYSGGWFKNIVDGVNTISAYSVPNGPSFIDDQGICIRGYNPADGARINAVTDITKMNMGGGVRDLKAEIAGKVYVGYVAQPFINEVSANMALLANVTTFSIPTNSAVELYNPYSVPLALEGYRLHAAGWDHVFGADDYIPANGFFVLYQAAGWTIDSTAKSVADAAVTVDPVGGTVSLQRIYLDRAGADQWVEVDNFDYNKLVDASTFVSVTDVPAANYTLERPNNGLTYYDAMAEVPGVRTQTQAPSLGVKNIGGTPLISFVVLGDRFAVMGAGSPVQGAPANNIGDLGWLMRYCNLVTIGSPSAISNLVGNILTSPPPAPYINMDAANLPDVGFAQLPYDAQLHFNFYTPANYFDASGTLNYDYRAIAFLDYCTWLDRVYDDSIQVDLPATGTPALQIDKLRLAGRVNVNTAAQTVLQAMPNMTTNMVTQIVNYRDRTGAYTPATVPGMGIRSVSELIRPALVASGTTPTTLVELYNLSGWSKIYTASTVRSDTFVVYGYLEAIKTNNAYTGAFDNSTVWYGPAVSSPAVGDPIQLLAKRRFMMIVDRSWCNYPRSDTVNFKLPRVVAFKEMPN